MGFPLLSIKASHHVFTLTGRILLSRCVSVWLPRFQAKASSNSRMFTTSRGRLNASPWVAHTLNAFTPIKIKSDGSNWVPDASSTFHTAYIALGSNLGDRVAWIEQACNEMTARGIKIKRTSSLWETEPMYVLDQEIFLNGACEIETSLDPIALLNELQDIENLLGRKKVIEKGPRNIDLDILLFDEQVIDHPRLQIPHVGIFEREFVLRPLAELIPGKALNPSLPWKLTQDYLNELTPSSPLSTITPLSSTSEPLRALQNNRRTQVMAIWNLTPDSFSDGNKDAKSLITQRVKDFLSSGATIIDIGGQSSAPRAPDVTSTEEIARIMPAFQVATTLLPRPILSVDTYRASVAEAAVQAGADIINDVSAGALDSDMLRTMARTGKTVCLMHMRGTPSTMSEYTDYPNGLIATIAEELLERVAQAEAAGIRRWRIILDPGIGFAKTQEQNLEILRRLDELRDWPGLRGLPWLLGSSRKGFIGKITGVQTPHLRQWGTAATVAAAVQGGADIVRVHDVEEVSQVVKMSDAIWRV
ncbi:folic acid synthesis protein (dihydropteroate synthase) [Phlyctema vagabunda]|uniref:Folic acid synthesis protein (Dihydropteroate synthase) n=1 Tax=Phlyctema vagabunda TaxID=108571 RepID=A0ABR4PL19_9HELO